MSKSYDGCDCNTDCEVSGWVGTLTLWKSMHGLVKMLFLTGVLFVYLVLKNVFQLFVVVAP